MLDIKSREHEILGYWAEHRVDEKVRQKNSKGKKFYFLDGPPYVTGELGAHHIWVETIKDIVLRYKRYRGLHVHDRAGFDVHGLPIEVKVEKLLNVNSKSDIESRLGVEKFVMACKDYAKEQSKGAISTYLRFGSSLDFNSVYMPYENYYISKGWGIFKEISRKGLLYKDLTPLAYCPKDETVLSAQGPEVEYEDETDASIFVRFKVDVKRSRKAKIRLPDNTYLLVWTTTPWTLPSNVAIAVNPKELYVVMRSGATHYIMAKERLDAFVEQANINAVLNAEFYGSELEGIYFTSPLENEVPKQKELAEYHRVILSESFVNVKEGTGVLHVAPGHGPEDYKLGKQHRMPTFSPIDQHARYTEDAGTFKGLKVPGEANAAVLEKLRESKDLLLQGTVRHSYPHCWRCHSKLIYRATEQWFVSVQKMKKKMLRANSRIVWHPSAASEWFADAVESSPDWCVSRQRYWGAPIPIWVCDSCKEMEVLGSSTELKQRAGLEKELFDLHKPYVDKVTFSCRKCSGTMSRVPDIFDVWYDSGISHTASLTDAEFDRLFPADWITESRDQIRGWFSVLLRTSIAVYGRASFKRVNIGGMIKDELGQEMHRHLGNTISGNELLDIVSADGFRLWCSSHPRWLELKLKRDELTEADRNIMTLYNIAELVKEFAILSGNDTRKQRKPSLARMQKEERWIVSRLNTLIGYATANLDEYHVDDAVKEIREFVLEDFSRFYLKFAKQRAELAGKAELRRLSVVTAYVLRQTLILSSIIMPFACEYIYKELFSADNRSIFMEKWPRQSAALVDSDLESDFKVLKDASKAILYLREQRNSKLRWPVRESVIETNDDAAIASLERMSNLLGMYTNSKSIRIVKGTASSKEIRPIFNRLGPEFKGHAQAIADELRKQDAGIVEKSVEESGYYRLHTGEGAFDIKPEQFTIIERASKGSGITAKAGNAELYVDVDTEMSEELKEELVTREVIRRIQMMRKESGLTRLDRISVYASADATVSRVLERNMGTIKKIVKAKAVKINAGFPKDAPSMSVEVLGARISLAIAR
ncbi:MAG: isoleucine--tRNA ligase [Candidatus Micrarchaeota archaeon]|nr:isoleucine--tRNA ligase [Candidatus Micrarchaeota archaeon]